MAATTSQVARIILECVCEERFDRADLIEESCKRAGYKYPNKVLTMLEALITSKAVYEEGGILKPGTHTIPTDGGSDKSEDTQALQDKIAGLEKELSRTKSDYKAFQEQHLREMEKVISAAKDGMAAANKRADMATGRIVEVQIKSDTKVVKKISGIFHERFEQILTLAKARKNIFLYGPTGSGKTHICEQVANSLNLPFSFIGCSTGMSEGMLGGRLLPVGNRGTFEYIIAEYANRYENGGIFLFDEFTAIDPNVAIMVSHSLSGKLLSIPNRHKNPYAKRHKDFICIAADNTIGTGSDRLYSSRNKQDHAILDRFQIGKVFMDYDPNLEKQLCPDDELREHLLKFRQKIRAHRMERSMSTRFLQDAYEMKHEWGWSHDNIDNAFFEGWRQDERNKVVMP